MHILVQRTNVKEAVRKIEVPRAPEWHPEAAEREVERASGRAAVPWSCGSGLAASAGWRLRDGVDLVTTSAQHLSRSALAGAPGNATYK